MIDKKSEILSPKNIPKQLDRFAYLMLLDAFDPSFRFLLYCGFSFYLIFSTPASRCAS